MNTYRVILQHCDPIGCEDYTFEVFGRDQSDAIWAAKEELYRMIGDETIDLEEFMGFPEVMDIDMIDPKTIL